VVLAACAHTPQPTTLVEQGRPATGPAEEQAVYLDQVVAALRDGYLASCRQRTRSDEYCDCAFGQLETALLAAEEPAPFPPTDPRAAQLERDIFEICSRDLPQDEIEAAFKAACVGGDPRKQPYCDCAWTNLHQQSEASTLLVPNGAPARYRGEMALACRGQYPAQLAREDFIRECSAGHTAAVSACACKWDKLTQHYTVEQIIAEVAEPSHVSGLSSCER
jgi:hypothetical protein